MWKNLLTNLLVSTVSKKYPAVGKAYGAYNKYGEGLVKPLIRAERYYGHNKRAGMTTEQALLKAAADAEVPLDKLTDLISRTTKDVGTKTIDGVLAGTAYGNISKEQG